jgi:hypothetical protein
VEVTAPQGDQNPAQPEAGQRLRADRGSVAGRWWRVKDETPEHQYDFRCEAFSTDAEGYANQGSHPAGRDLTLTDHQEPSARVRR